MAETQSKPVAKRSEDADDMRLDLITPIPLMRIGRIYQEGLKYGEDNWLLEGFTSRSLLKHALRHLMLWLLGDRKDDHLAKVCWGLFCIMHFEVTDPSRMRQPQYMPEGEEAACLERLVQILDLGKADVLKTAREELRAKQAPQAPA